MKTILTILFIGCLAQLCPAQTINNDQENEIRITTGRRTGCFGSGMCTITKIDENNRQGQANAILITKKDGSSLLRVYRDRISKRQETNLLGTTITAHNKNSLVFVMEEALPLSSEIKNMTSNLSSRQIQVLPVGNYETIITEKYINIILVN